MKKILAIVLAVCLTLALTCTAFADKSPTLNDYSPVLDPWGGVSSGNEAISKLTYSATDANGSPVMVAIAFVTAGAEYDEIAAYGVKGMYCINVLSAVSGPITIDVYCKGASSSSKVIVRDAWELLEGANLKVSGDRVTFTADAEMINKYNYFAVVDNFEAVDVDTPTEPGDNGEDVEGGDDVNVNDTDNTPAPEKNPGTGVALAVVPMMVAAAAIVASKKR